MPRKMGTHPSRGWDRGSRAVQDLDIRPNNVQRRRLDLDESAAIVPDTWLEHYCNRDDCLEDESLLQVVRRYT